MYLSLLHLNPSSPHVQRDVRDVAAMHRTVMHAYPDLLDPASKPRERYSVLYRLEFSQSRGWLLYVQSAVRPDWDSLPAEYVVDDADGGLPGVTTKSVAAAYDSLRSGQLLRFRLRANATRKIDTKSGPDGQKRNGRRVPLYKAEDQIAWLMRVAERSGFQLQQVVISGTGASERVQGRSRNLQFQGVLFEGVLQVSDPDQFRQALRDGIGPGKAYGFGLLSIGPA
jgi:CRISPR system Cascade subunit CasE